MDLATEITEGTEKNEAAAKLSDVATAQTLSYLKSAGLKRALLINFSQARLVAGIKRISL